MQKKIRKHLVFVKIIQFKVWKNFHKTNLEKKLLSSFNLSDNLHQNSDSILDVILWRKSVLLRLSKKKLSKFGENKQQKKKQPVNEKQPLQNIFFTLQPKLLLLLAAAPRFWNSWLKNIMSLGKPCFFDQIRLKSSASVSYWPLHNWTEIFS